MITYLSLSMAERLVFSQELHNMRDVLLAENRRKKRSPKKKKKSTRKPRFFNDKIERLFDSMPEECKNFIRNGE